jgi:small-conductance mechanosensitive channel/CRP-like cAMP-binding protein
VPGREQSARAVEPWTAFLHEELLPYWGVAVGVAAVLIVAMRLFLPVQHRARIRAPVALLVGAMALFAIRAILPDRGGTVAASVRGAVDLGALAFLLFALGRSTYLLLLHLVLDRRDKGGSGRSLPAIFRDLIQVGVYAVIVLVLLRAAGVELGSLLTTSALLSVVIGFALQDTLGNLFAGLAIQAQQPFEVGDWIQFDDDNDHIGEVIEINWRATRIQTIDRVEVIVPNGTLAKAAIRNYSKPTRLTRRHVTVSAPQETPPARVHRLLLEAVSQVDGVRPQPPPDVQTIQFSERGLEYRVRYFIEQYDQREIIDGRVRDRLWYTLRRAALPIPPPQRKITLVEQNAEGMAREAQAKLADVERALSGVPLFKPLPPELLHELAVQTDRRLYAPGEMVIKEGDAGAELFVVERGKVDVLVQHGKKSERVASLGPRDFFGEMSLLTGEQRRATVRADGEVVLLVVSKESVQPILEASPDLANEISAVLAAREIELGRHKSTSEDPSARTSVEERRGELLTRIRQFFSI